MAGKAIFCLYQLFSKVIRIGERVNLTTKKKTPFKNGVLWEKLTNYCSIRLEIETFCF